MSNGHINIPQPPEIIEALRAAGCGILRRSIIVEAPDQEPVKKLPTLPPVERAPRKLDLRTIRSVVAAICEISVNELISARRHVPVCRARHIYYAVARDMTGQSLPQIGKYCGDRDHSTVLHGIAKVEEDREYFEPELSRVSKYLKRMKGVTK